jgi:flagellar hook-length control protein FliK
MQPGGAPAIKAVEDFIKDLPAIKDLVTALSSSRGKDEKQTAESRGEKTETKGKHAEQSARLHEDGSREARLRMNVRDQRVNDPHSLREAVRIVKRQPAQGEDLRPGGRADKVSSVPPAEQAVMPPVKAPTAGRDSSLWMQQDSSSRMSQSVKKTSVPEPLTNARQIVEQVVERARVTVKSGMTEMRLQLNPRNMGRVGMHFSLNADGELTAKLMASNESVRQYLQENISSFAHDLADAGVVVAHIEVAAEGAGRQFTQDGKSAKQEDGERSGLFPSGLGEGLAELDPRQGANRHDGRLDVRA